MFVSLGYDNLSVPTAAVTGITYNGVALTQLWSVANGVSTRSEGWILVAPASGSNWLVITFTGILGLGMGTGNIHLNGVNQATPNRTLATNKVIQRSKRQCNLTPSNAVSGDMVIDAMAGYNGSLTKGAAQTTIADNFPSVAGGGMDMVRYLAATGSTAMTWTLGSNGYWSTGAVALIPATSNFSGTPGVGAIAKTGEIPTLKKQFFFTPGVASLVKTGFQPTLARGLRLSPSPANIIKMGQKPNLSAPFHGVPGLAQIVKTGQIPVLALSGSGSGGIGPYHSFYVKPIGIKTKIAGTSQVDSDTGDTP